LWVEVNTQSIFPYRHGGGKKKKSGHKKVMEGRTRVLLARGGEFHMPRQQKGKQK